MKSPLDAAMRDGAPERWDVVICGGGLAGLLLARQIRRELPALRIAVIDRLSRPLPDACLKVGESTVELGAQYLERCGLREYLLERQLIKWGLRFFPGGGELPLHERTEIGPCAEPIVSSYQLDRGRLESDLRGMIEADGATLFEGTKVTAIELATGKEAHVIRCERAGAAFTLRARWVVDATGRAAIVRRKHKLTRASKHVASAGWYRIRGRFDIGTMVPREHADWHSRPCAAQRWLSTNHLMGEGYWAWVIPLASGNTSIGVVIHEDTHDPIRIAGLARTQAFLHEHEPHLAAAIANWEVLDFLCLRDYSYSVSQAWSEDRWAIVGVAGAFVDPLYSPGTDFIAYANCFTVELMRRDALGEDRAALTARFNFQYRALLSGSFLLFRTASRLYGHPSAMAYKVFWNNFAYWSFTCQYLHQDLYLLPEPEHERVTVVGRRFLELSANVEHLLRTWATLAPERPTPIFRMSPAFPSVHVEAHTAVGRRMSRDDALAYISQRLEEGHELIGEMVIRIVQELGVETAQALLEEVKFFSWGISISSRRLELESLPPSERRYALPELARDAERTLGPVRRHARAREALELLGHGAAR